MKHLLYEPIYLIASVPPGLPHRSRNTTFGRFRNRVIEMLATSDRNYLIERLEKAASRAEQLHDFKEMQVLSFALLRLGVYERAWQLRVATARLRSDDTLPEWDGSDLSGRTILVRPYLEKHFGLGGVGQEIQFARFIAPIAQRARRCIVLAEKRLVPLLRRTFPGVDIWTRGIDDARALSEADVAAYYATLASFFAKNEEEVRTSFVRLRPDQSAVESLRRRYHEKVGGPLIGVSWWSNSKKKELPNIRSWAPLLAWNSVSFVALQYGDVTEDLAVLQSLASGRIIHDAQIDQLVDLDGFAAQIASLDAVVSVSNTTADMAGMLGIPTLHIRGDRLFLFPGIWPVSGASPWYPNMIFLYKRGRPWPDLFEEAKEQLEQIIPMARG